MDTGIWWIILWLMIWKFDNLMVGAYKDVGGYWKEYSTYFDHRRTEGGC